MTDNLARLAGLVDEASASWTSAEWTHYRRVDGAELEEICAGDVADVCDTCAAAAVDAGDAAAFGLEALELAKAGSWEAAFEAARAAARLEDEWGDDPSWGPVAAAFASAARAASPEAVAALLGEILSQAAG